MLTSLLCFGNEKRKKEMASKCPNCGSKLIFSPDYGALCCDMCGGIYMPEDIEADSKDQELLDLNEMLGSDKGFDTTEFKVYSCSSCGGEIIINDTEASTYCIYCGNPSIVFSRVTKERKPDSIIPFKISREDAANAIRALLKPVGSIPNKLKKFDISDIRGIYIPYLIVDVEYRGAQFIEKRVSKRENDTRLYERAGRCDFNDIPVEASTKLDDEASIRLEPYDLSELVPFDEDYLTGFYSDVCDLDRSRLDRNIKKRLKDIFDGLVSKSCWGHLVDVKFSSSSIVHRKAPEYALIPVWFLSFFREGKPYTILVNGQTGKVVCSLPWDKKKLIRDTFIRGFFCAIPFFALTALATFCALTGAHVEALLKFAIGAICGAAGMLIAGTKRLQTLKSRIAMTQSYATFRFVKERQD